MTPNAGAGRVARVAAAACIAAPALVALDAPPWLRFPAVLLLFCLAPGAALVGLLRARDRPSDLGLVVVLSLGVDTLVAQAALALDLWRPRTLVYLLAATCLILIAAAAVVARRQKANAEPTPAVP